MSALPLQLKTKSYTQEDINISVFQQGARLEWDNRDMSTLQCKRMEYGVHMYVP